MELPQKKKQTPEEQKKMIEDMVAIVQQNKQLMVREKKAVKLPEWVFTYEKEGEDYTYANLYECLISDNIQVPYLDEKQLIILLIDLTNEVNSLRADLESLNSPKE